MAADVLKNTQIRSLTRISMPCGVAVVISPHTWLVETVVYLSDRLSQVICFRAAAISDFLERYNKGKLNHVLVTSSLNLYGILISRCHTGA